MRAPHRTPAALCTLAVAAATLTVAAGVAGTAGVSAAGATPNVTTAAYGPLRDDWDANEPGLSPSAVQSPSFGQVFSSTLSGAVYAQPLVVNGTVVVTTEKANAYGVSATTGAVKWTRSFGVPFAAATIGCSDLTPDIGSTSTPVVDPSTGTVYLTARLENGSGGLANAHWYLEALSSSTGVEAPGYPVEISGTPSNTPGVPFNDAFQQQRPALLLLGGVVYMAFASDCDITPYRGVVVGVSTATHAITTMWSDESGIGTDTDSQAGIWQSGGGLVSDAPNRIILTTGNGVSPQPAPSGQPPATLSESVLSLAVGPKGKLTPTQFFSPSNAAALDSSDEDLGAGGPIALPPSHFGTTAHPKLVVQVGKDGRVFLMDVADMGGFKQGSGAGDAVLQSLGPYGGVWGHPAAYGGQGGWVYVLESAGGGYLRALSYGVDGRGEPRLASAGTSSGSFGYTSGSPVVTSTGTTSGSAVVWAVYSSGPGGAGAQLRAYGGAPSGGVLPLLWSAPIGVASKFTTPTAWNGRVYVGTRDGHLLAFGSSTNAPLQAAPVNFGSVPVATSKTVTLSASVTRALSITGPVTAAGYQNVTGPAPAAPAGGNGSTTPGSTTPGSTTPGSTTPGSTTPGSTTPGAAPAAPTAGPTTLPPSGSTPIAGSVFSVVAPAPGTVLAAGSTLSVRVTFNPTGAGPVVASLSVPTSAGTRTIPLTGYGSAPGLLISAQPLTFGTVQTGAGGRELGITFSNSWNRPETLTGFKVPGAPYHAKGLPAVGTVLAPGQAVTASLDFDPTAAGTYRSKLTLSTSDGSVTLPVTGAAAAGTAHLAVAPAVVPVGPVRVGHAVTVSFGVGNSGTVALVVTRAIAPLGAFSTSVPMPEGITIEPGTVLHQTVTFRPTAVGPVSGRYVFNSSTGQGPVTVTLTGTGT